VEVVLYLDLGYNDVGEMIPGQGGTNEQVVNTMYKDLAATSKDNIGKLKVYWYTGKDMIEPYPNSVKKRSCHVKFCSVDGEIAIIGNGNQDTQSWFHSQEINLLIDSPSLVGEWLEGLDANQNTGLYGGVDPKDGVWRSPKDGHVIESSGIKKAGVLGSLKGLTGAVARVQGKGGF